jgi:transcriptional regulator with XRE-family HTH domain
MRRKMLAMSQEKLGTALGLTFQQVQKYESGANRIGGSRLQQISQILQVPIAFFFDDGPGASAVSKSAESALSLAHVDDFVSSSEGLRLITAFSRIESVTLRRRITSLVQEMADWNRGSG